MWPWLTFFGSKRTAILLVCCLSLDNKLSESKSFQINSVCRVVVSIFLISRSWNLGDVRQEPEARVGKKEGSYTVVGKRLMSMIRRVFVLWLWFYEDDFWGDLKDDITKLDWAQGRWRWREDQERTRPLSPSSSSFDLQLSQLKGLCRCFCTQLLMSLLCSKRRVDHLPHHFSLIGQSVEFTIKSMIETHMFSVMSCYMSHIS